MADCIGRFAPSPTGALHLGSMVAAVASYLDARARGGQWLVRMEDLDPPREVAGSADAILRTLESFGLFWDGEVVYQSQRHARYEDVLAELMDRGLAFACNCSRAMLGEHKVYPGTCRGLKEGRAYRLLTGPGQVSWQDGGKGVQSFDLTREVGDFILRRGDGHWAYHLAVVVDDYDAGVTHVVRGEDLLTSTARHLILLEHLKWSPPKYHHLPLVLNAEGQKLSKQTLATPVDSHRPALTLQRVFNHLQLPVRATADVKETLIQAQDAWGRLLESKSHS
ncbi:MAG: tRNA glutamyl-Q(34) synthetase GluQRS [Flavobacteriales bacterium]